MDERGRIHKYDVVKVTRVPEPLKGVIDVGDIGIVIEKHDEETFEIECVTPDGSYKWLETLNIRYVSKYLGSSKGQAGKPIMQKSIILGSLVGAIFGGLMGAGLGAITGSLNGMLVGWIIGLILGVVTGALTAALTVKTAGTTGGIGTGYFTGMIFGAVFGMVVGLLIPTSLRTRAHTENLPVLDALMMGRFETAMLASFLLSILSTIVGIWVGAKNQVPRNLK